MKRIILAAFLLMGMSLAQAQESKYYVGGTLGFTWSKIKTGGGSQSGASVKLMPEVGYHLDSKWSVGVGVGYSHGYAAFGGIDFNDIKSIGNAVASTAADVANDNAAKINSFRIAPYARYNFWQTGKLKFFLEGSIGYVHIGVKTGDGGDFDDDFDFDYGDVPSLGAFGDPALNIIEFNIRPGLSYDASKKITLLAKVGSLGFIHGKEKQSGVKLNRFGFDMDTYNILLGMNYNF